MRGWHLLLAGEPRVVHPDGRVRRLAERDALLLAWLALEGPSARGTVAGLLWPDSATQAARATLRQRLFQLKQTCGAELVAGKDTLELAAGVSHDLQGASTILGSFQPESGQALAAWLDAQRTRRRHRLLQSVTLQCDACEAKRDWAGAIRCAHELLALDALSEAAHRRVMRLHYLIGNRAAALAAFDRCELMLKQEIGARPSAATLGLLDTIIASGGANEAADTLLPAAALHPPRLVGRIDLLRRARQSWADGRTLWIVAEAGMGKTRLLQELVAGRPGYLLVSARPGDASMPYGALSRSLRAVIALVPPSRYAEFAVELCGLLPELASIARSSAGKPPTVRLPPLLQGVTALLAAGRAAGMEAVLFDDLHFADAATLEALLSLQQVAAGIDLRWALAHRPAEGEAGLQTLCNALLDSRSIEVLTLAPLNCEQTQELVASLGLVGVDAGRLGAELYRHTGGNPLFALETLRQAWAEDTLSSGHLPRPSSVAWLIERRLNTLSKSALKLLRCAAVAGADFSVDLAVDVMAKSALDLADAYGELERAQVLAEGRFAHDLIFEAARRSVPVAIARHLHARIAAALQARQAAPARLAFHWVEACDWSAAAAAYLQASNHARRDTRVREALSFLLEAAQCHQRAGEPEARFDALAQHALLLSAFEFADEADAASRALDAEAANEVQALQAQLVRMTLQINRLELGDIMHDAPNALARARALGERGLEIGLASQFAYALSSAGRSDEAISLLQPWMDEDVSATIDTRCHYLLALAFALDRGNRLLDAMSVWDRALALPAMSTRPDLAWQAISNRASTLAKIGRVTEAVQPAEQALRIATSQGEAPLGRVLQAQVILALRLRDVGRYEEALELLEQARGEFEAAELRSNLAYVQHGLAVTYQHLGQPERALALLQDGLDASLPDLAVMRLLHRAEVYRRLGRDGQAYVNQALDLITDSEDVYHQVALLFASVFAEPGRGLALAEAVADWACRRERLGLALAARVRAASCALAVGSTTAALGHVQAADAWAPNHQPGMFYPAEFCLVAAQVRLVAGQPEGARIAARRGSDWIAVVRDKYVPNSFRASFADRNPVNRALLAMASRLA